MTYDQLHSLLLDPQAWPMPTHRVEWRETHISHLYLGDELVIKIKKPVNFGFLDFSTPALRRHFCREEVRLNRRFAPNTYLGAFSLGNDEGRLVFDRHGRGGEWVVLMRRLADGELLPYRIASGDPRLPADMERLARRLIQLHRHSTICRNDRGQSDLERVRTNWKENFDQTEAFPESILPFACRAGLARYVTKFLCDHESLFREREERGLVRDGHGDLHAEHVCLGQPIRIFDCIEFNRRFRVSDILADLAFLLMDLRYRGRRDIADQLLGRYFEAFPGGAAERELVRFYIVYRAYVRGKINGLLAGDINATPEHRSQGEETARRYFNFALATLPQRPQLVLLCGPMGTGKSTVAARLAPLLEATVLSSDVLRKELAGLAPTIRCATPFGTGLYSATMSTRTYVELLRRAMALLRQGESVIVDASFMRRSDRQSFRQSAADQALPCTPILVVCPMETALRRLVERQRIGSDASDGRPELCRQQHALFEYPDRAESILTIDTRHDLDYNIQAILFALTQKTSGA